MIIVLKEKTVSKQVKDLVNLLSQTGCQTSIFQENGRRYLRLNGCTICEAEEYVKDFNCIESMVFSPYPFEMASRSFKKKKTEFLVKKVRIGGSKIVMAAGPCAVEDRETLFRIARDVKSAGADILRGGAYKPRSSPYSFQGLEKEGLKILSEVGSLVDMPVITEVIDQYSIETVASYSDIIQVGARNMQNFRLLKELGQVRNPVLLKRGMSATIEEWLMAAEYILAEGNGKVILCERGIRTFEKYTRNTLDLSAVPVASGLSHLPVFVDPSHGTGRWKYVKPMSMASLAAGADGLVVEVHVTPEKALCDGEQSLLPEKFAEMMSSLKKVALTLDRTL